MFSTVGMCEQAVAAFTKVHTINKSFSLTTVICAVHSSKYFSDFVGSVWAGFYNFLKFDFDTQKSALFNVIKISFLLWIFFR